MPPPGFGMRDVFKVLSPPWLRAGVDERKGYAWGLGCDAVLDKLTQGVLDRFPTRADSSALPLLSADRQLLRGLTEADDSFAARLQRVFDSYQLSGTARATLSQVLGYLLQTTPLVRTVSSRYEADPGRVQKQLTQVLGYGVVDATNTSSIVVETGIPNGFGLSDSVTVTGARGNTAANGVWQAVPVDETHFGLQFSNGNGAYTGGGRVILTADIPSTSYPPTRLSSMWNTYQVGRDPGAEPIPECVLSGGGNWDWDSVSQVDDSWTWWGAFLVLVAIMPNNWTDPPEWSWNGTLTATGADLTWDTIPGSWGLSVTWEVIESIRIIVKQFKSAQSVVRWIIVSFDESLFDPAQPSNGVYNPNGDFGHWSKIVAGEYVAARYDVAEYCDGVI